MRHSSPFFSRLSRTPWADWFVWLACGLAGLVARLYGLGDKPFWLDEVTTLQRASLPFGALVYDALSFHHLPPYFIVSSWFLPLGRDETALRLPAALFGALSCGLAAFVATRLAGRPAGLLAGMMMAFAPVAVQYGQEARSYTLIICLVLVALHGLIGILRRAPEPAPRAAWAAYVGGTLAGMLVLGVALSWFAIANLAALIVLRGPRLRRWLLAQAAIALAAAPGYVAMVVLVGRVHGTFQSGLDWIPPLTWPHLRITVDSLYLLGLSSLIADRLFAQPLPWLGAVAFALAIAGVVALRRDRRAAGVLVLCVLGLPVAVATISIVQPLFMARYLLWGTAPMLVLAGCGVAVLPMRARMPVAAVLSVACAVNLLPYYRIETKPRWELAARIVQAQVRPGELLLIDDPGAVNMMNVFLARTGAHIADRAWTEDVGVAVCALAQGHRVWALQGRVGQADHETQATFLGSIAALGAPAALRRIGLDIVLERFDRPVAPCASAAAPAPVDGKT